MSHPWLHRTGVFVFILATLNSAVALGSHYAVNAERLGAHHLGVALSSAYASAFSFVLCLAAAPVLLIASALVAPRSGRIAWWFLSAAVMSSIPLVVV